MNRFLLFAYNNYYPTGGWKDLWNSYPTKEEAETAAAEVCEKHGFGEWHVVDLEEQAIVSSR